MDISDDVYSRLTRRIDTQRFGPFVFQVGVDSVALALPLQRVDDAHRRFAESLLAHVVNAFEREVIASSIFGTNTIEGGTLSEDETFTAMDLDPQQVQAVEQRRVLDIKTAYEHARGAALDPAWTPSINFIRSIHTKITHELPDPDNRPGQFRNNPKGRITHVGSRNDGGRHKPPQYEGDIMQLLEALIGWHTELSAANVHPLVRAPLMHYYFELIHPFWDGNGRVGRVLEATLLQAAGYNYAPFALARYYLDNLECYFTLFNTCRKAAEQHQPHANTAFVLFSQEGMLATINHLHNRVDRLVSALLFQNCLHQLLEEKSISPRQYTIVTQLLAHAKSVTQDELRRTPWFASLYLKLNDKTSNRDMKKLQELRLVLVDAEKQVWPVVAP